MADTPEKRVLRRKRQVMCVDFLITDKLLGAMAKQGIMNTSGKQLVQGYFPALVSLKYSCQILATAAGNTTQPSTRKSESCCILSLPNPLKPCVYVENKDVVGAAPIGVAPTTSELSTSLLPKIFNDDVLTLVRNAKNVILLTLQLLVHDDVIKWKHFPRYWPFVWRIHRSLVNSTHKSPSDV